LRGETFVTRKITRAVAQAYSGAAEVLLLGNLDAKRDWGYAKDYVKAMWLMLQQEHPDDYVIASGQMFSVRDFVREAFAQIGISIVWRGVGVHEQGVDERTGKVYVRVDQRYVRPTEVHTLLGDARKARRLLGWEPTLDFYGLVQLMVQEDIKLLAPLVSAVHQKNEKVFFTQKKRELQ